MKEETGLHDKKLKALCRIVESKMGKQIIIATTQRVCLKLRDYLRQMRGIRCEVVVAQTPNHDCKTIINDFFKNEFSVLITTQAFAVNMPLPQITQVCLFFFSFFFLILF